jgi:integrase/recombinase XerD
MKTMSQLVVDYLAWRCACHGGRPAGDTIRHALGKFVQWLGAVPQVRVSGQLTPEIIQRWVHQEATRPSAYSGVPLKTVSQQNQNRILTVFCYWLHHRGHVPIAVPQAFPKPRRLPILVKPALSHRDMRRLLQQIPCETPIGYRNRALGEFLYTTGVRIAEALASDLDDLDLDSGTARIRGKGNRDRVVPVGQGACRHLRVYLASIRPKLLRSRDEHAVWLGHRGRRLMYDCFYRQWRRMLSGLVLPTKVTAHTFRRSCATELHRNGAPPWAIKEMLGHRELDTLRYYLDLRVEDLKRTHARFHPRDQVAEQ